MSARVQLYMAVDRLRYRHPRAMRVWDRLTWRWQHRALELWHRRDVGGHDLFCPTVPAIPQDDGSVTCACYASIWRVLLR